MENSKIYLFNLHKTARGEAYEKDAFIYSQILTRIMIDEHINIIDVRSKIGFEHLLPDGIHLNRRGHIKYADIVMDAFGYDESNPDWCKDFLSWNVN